jgi:RNA polymerase sigma factor (sigma-70 family)
VNVTTADRPMTDPKQDDERHAPTPHVLPTSEALAQRATRGDGAALTELIERERDHVYRLSMRMLWHPEDAADATQEILFKVVTNVGTFRGESSFRTWTLRIATNHLLNLRRSRLEEQSLTFLSFGRDLLDGLADVDAVPVGRPVDQPDQALLEEEVKIGCTQAMLLCLERQERIAYILGDVFEMSSVDASTVLDIEPATFRKRLARARARVRDFMTAHCGLVESSAACSCARRVKPALERRRIDPANLLFAGKGTEGPRRLPVLEAVGEMEHLHRIAGVFQSHPDYQLPERVVKEIRRVLDSAATRSLLG